jgi:hypothetical protein
MLKKLCCLMLAFTLSAVFTGCAENEHKVTTEKQEQHESAPHDSSPGKMIVE